MTGEKLLRSDSVADRVAADVRGGILSRRHLPGEHLVEADLCELYECSRPALRAALRKLASEGLVEVLPHRGTRVRRVGRDEAGNILVVLQALTARAARLVAARDDRAETAAELRRLLGVVRQSHQARDSASTIRHWRELQVGIAEAAANAHLSKIVVQGYRELQIAFEPFPSLTDADFDFLEESIATFSRAIDAIEDGDGALASRLVFDDFERADIVAS